MIHTIFIPMMFRVNRKRLNKTLSQVSADTKISLSFLSDIEQGRTLPSIKTLLQLVDYYEMDFPSLFLREEE